MSPPHRVGAGPTLRDLREGRSSCAALMRATLDTIEKRDPETRAWAVLDGERAMAQAQAADRVPAGQRGRLHGLPLAVKDTYDTADFATERGSPLWRGRRPLRDATMVTRAREAGAIVVGKTVTTEFALLHPGPTRNPHKPMHTPGGSSSGSAAAVAAGMVPLALGSQTNGSMLRPASFCGVFAIKPSYGLLPRTGLQPIAAPLDTPGVFGNDLEGLAIALEVMSGSDGEDADSRAAPASGFADALQAASARRWRIGFCRSPVWNRCDRDARDAMLAFVDQLRRRIAVVDVELPAGFGNLHEHHMVIQDHGTAEQLSALARAKPDDFSAALLDTVHRGSAVTPQRLQEALNFQSWARTSMDRVFDAVDVLIGLAATGEAPSSLSTTGDPVMQTIWTFTGTPALNVPSLRGARGLPIGVQVTSRRGRDADVLAFAAYLQGLELAPALSEVPEPPVPPLHRVDGDAA